MLLGYRRELVVISPITSLTSRELETRGAVGLGGQIQGSCDGRPAVWDVPAPSLRSR